MLSSDAAEAYPAAAEARVEPGALTDFRVVGLNYRTAAVGTRSTVSFTESGIRSLLADLRERGVVEALALSTCNRTEVYFYATDFEPVLASLVTLSEVDPAKLEAVTYQYEGSAAVRQLFRVACGLDSAVLGEHEVLGQLKVAHRIAKETGSVGRRIEPLYQRALRASKRVRTESELCREVTSIGSMALRKAAHLAGGLADLRILLIGAGQIAERVAKDLFHAECKHAYVCNRTSDRAGRLAELYGLKEWQFDNLDRGLAMADLVICAVSSPIPVLTEQRLLAARNGKEVVVVDLGVPPNYSPETTCQGHKGPVRLVEMEAIVRACQAGSQSRAAAVPKATTILEEELSSLELDLLEREAAPYIQALTVLAEEVRTRNLEWALGQNPTASARERKLLEDLSIRIVRGMLEGPIQALKSELRQPVERAVLARLFAVEAPQVL